MRVEVVVEAEGGVVVVVVVVVVVGVGVGGFSCLKLNATLLFNGSSLGFPPLM
jgi:hypothetical protein